MYKAVITFITVLAGLFLPAIIIAWLLSLSVRTHYGGIAVISPKRLIWAVSLPVVCGIRELYRQSLTISGVAAAVLIGFILTLANVCFISSLLMFFFTSSKLTKFRAKKKADQDEEAASGARRTWLNVFNNGGVPTAVALLYIVEVGCRETLVNFDDPHYFISSWLSVSVLGAIASACGDTWASEIGSAFGKGTSTLISTGSTVPAGTNGGVTTTGTLSSLAGGFTVGLTYAITNWLTTQFSSFQWSLAWIGAFAGLAGSTIDSLLGATLQYSGFNEETKKVVSRPGPDVKHISGINLLSNHAVNFISCCFTSLLAPFIYQFVISFT